MDPSTVQRSYPFRPVQHENGSEEIEEKNILGTTVYNLRDSCTPYQQIHIFSPLFFSHIISFMCTYGYTQCYECIGGMWP